MRPLTDSTPKALLRAAGRPLIEYHLDRLRAAGIDDIVINTAWLGSLIRAHLGDGTRLGVRIRYSDEGDTALETGGGIHKALPLLGDEPFWIVNADVFCDYSFGRSDMAPDTLAHLVMVPNPEHNPDGDFALIEGQIRVDRRSRYTYSGIALLRGELLRDESVGKFPLAPLLTRAAAAGAVTGELYDGSWIDVGTPERLRAVDTHLRAR